MRPEAEDAAARFARLFEEPGEGCPALAPVVIEHVRDHPFARRARRGCATCERGKERVVHLGYPRSFNVWGSGAHRHVYQAQKKSWEERFLELLARSGLPKGLGHITVEGKLTFPDHRRRDQGNYRYPIEKALGDALVAGGYLADDKWDSYEFGGLQQSCVKGVAKMKLMLFPSW